MHEIMVVGRTLSVSTSSGNSSPSVSEWGSLMARCLRQFHSIEVMPELGEGWDGLGASRARGGGFAAGFGYRLNSSKRRAYS